MTGKKPRWRIVRGLEEKLKILKRSRREFRLVLVSMLQDAIELVENGETPIIVARSVREKGKHRYSTVHSVFSALSEYQPALLHPHNNFSDGKIAIFTSSFFDVIRHDLGILNELEKIGEISELDRTSIQKLGELVDKFQGFCQTVVGV